MMQVRPKEFISTRPGVVYLSTKKLSSFLPSSFSDRFKQTLAILIFAITLVQGAKIKSVSGLDREFMHATCSKCNGKGYTRPYYLWQTGCTECAGTGRVITVTKKMESLVDQLTHVLKGVAVKGRVNAEILLKRPEAKAKIKEILESLNLHEDDWAPFCEDESNSITAKDENGDYKSGPKGYVRNVVYEHPGLFVVKVLVWSSDAKSPIHSHGGSECFVLVLEGDVKETQYTWDREEMIARKDNGEGPLVTDSDKPSKIAVYSPGQVTDIDDFDAVHVIENPHKSWALQMMHKTPHKEDSIKHKRKMVTLHVYVPNYNNPVILKLPSEIRGMES